MKKFTVRPATPRTLQFACATVLAVAFGSTFPQQAYAQRETPPPVPDTIQVPAVHRLFMVVTPSVLRTTSACPRAPASPGRCSARKPRCSTTTPGK